jgi:60S ribosome subunit biogenesis protein NIP7
VVQVWVKPSQEMSYLYGNHILKSGLGRITDNTPEHQVIPILIPIPILSSYFSQGVVILTMSDIPIGFGVTAKSTQQCRKVEGTGIVVYHQADVGEYLREEGHLT